MKEKSLFTVLLLCILTTPVFAQDSNLPQPETFEMADGDTTYVMQKYFIVFLKSGPERSQNEEEAAKLQQEHLAYLGGLYEDGIINLNGPTGGEGDIRGFSVYNVATIDQAIEYAENDPMVQAGRLVVEVHPWWVAKGSVLK